MPSSVTLGQAGLEQASDKSKSGLMKIEHRVAHSKMQFV